MLDKSVDHNGVVERLPRHSMQMNHRGYAAAIRDREPGTFVYACHQVDGAPRQRIFYELYRDRAAFEEHERQEHVRHFLAAREALLESTEVDFLTLTNGKTRAAQTAESRT